MISKLDIYFKGDLSVTKRFTGIVVTNLRLLNVNFTASFISSVGVEAVNNTLHAWI